NNCSCNRLSKPFFTIVAYHLRDFARRGARQKRAPRFAARRIHPHVEWSVGAKREPARRIVDLWRGNAEVEQEAVDARDAERCQCVGEFRKPAPVKREARVSDRLRATLGFGITIERNEASGRSEPGEDRARVSAAGTRRIYAHALPR